MNSTAARPVDPLTLAAPRSLPAWVYNHPEMTRLEYERILKPSWQIACHISQIPQSGDYVTFELGPDSVIVLREGGGAKRPSCAPPLWRSCAATPVSRRRWGGIARPSSSLAVRYRRSILASMAWSNSARVTA